MPFTKAEFQTVLRSDAITSPYLPPVGGPVDAINRWEGLLFPATYPITDATTHVPSETVGDSGTMPASESLNGASLPKSMYLKEKPAWFGDLAWPPFGPDTDFEKNKIPAQVRYEKMIASEGRK